MTIHQLFFHHAPDIALAHAVQSLGEPSNHRLRCPARGVTDPNYGIILRESMLPGSNDQAFAFANPTFGGFVDAIDDVTFPAPFTSNGVFFLGGVVV